MARTKKPADRKILIDCDFADQVAELLDWVSVQLSDGYWEGEENFYGEYWNCFDFKNEYETGKRNKVAIIVKGEATYNEHKKDTQRFLAMSDSEVCDYVKGTVFDLIEDYGSVFDRHYSEREMETLQACITEWKVLPPPLPKMTHKELVALVGHDFEYVKE